MALDRKGNIKKPDYSLQMHTGTRTLIFGDTFCGLGDKTQNRCYHEERTSCRNIEVTSEDIRQEVKAWAQTGLPNGQ